MKTLADADDDVLMDVPMYWFYLPDFIAKPCLEFPEEDAKRLIAAVLDTVKNKSRSKEFITGLLTAAALVSVRVLLSCLFE